MTIWGTSYVTLQGISFRRFTAAKNPSQRLGGGEERSARLGRALEGDGLSATLTPASALKAHHQFRITVAAGSDGVRYRTAPSSPRAGTARILAPTGTGTGQIGTPIKVTFRTGG